MPDLTKQYEKKLLKAIAENNGNILSVYEQAIEEITFTASTLPYQGGTFSIANYPKIDKQISSLLEKMHTQIYALTLNGINDGWDLSNDKNNIIVDKRLGTKAPGSAAKKILYDPNLDALNKFIKRKEQGLNLSDRVWNTLDPFPSELTKGLGLGISQGQSANSMAKDLKQYLKNPDKLFRRVKDAQGKLRISKAARDYHPGQGVYRSSYKNARRLAATEQNIAYRSADFERWQKLPFVVGIQIHTSSNHPKYDICDELEGQYPKDFKFTGWHPHCICYATAEQMTDDEYDKFEDAILNGDDEALNLSSSQKVVDTPDGFKDWINENSERIAGYSSKPYYIKDNPLYVADKGAKFAPVKKPASVLVEAVGLLSMAEAIKAMEDYKPTPAQQAAIKEYTQSGYGPINRYLRSGINPTIEKRTSVEFIKGFLNGAPKGIGTSYRSMRFDETGYNNFLTGIKEGNGLKDKGFMSTSLDKEEAQFFRSHALFGVNIEILGKNGVPIARFSDIPTEKEVLFNAGTEFDVITYEEQVYENGQKVLTLKLQER